MKALLEEYGEMIIGVIVSVLLISMVLKELWAGGAIQDVVLRFIDSIS